MKIVFNLTINLKHYRDMVCFNHNNMYTIIIKFFNIFYLYTFRLISSFN